MWTFERRKKLKKGEIEWNLYCATALKNTHIHWIAPNRTPVLDSIDIKDSKHSHLYTSRCQCHWVSYRMLKTVSTYQTFNKNNHFLLFSFLCNQSIIFGEKWLWMTLPVSRLIFDDFIKFWRKKILIKEISDLISFGLKIVHLNSRMVVHLSNKNCWSAPFL